MISYITKSKFEDNLLELFDEITDEFAPLCVSRVTLGKGKGMDYVDRRTNNIIAHWCKGRGEVFNFTRTGHILPRLKINLINGNFSLTPTKIWAMIRYINQTGRNKNDEKRNGRKNCKRTFERKSRRYQLESKRFDDEAES